MNAHDDLLELVGYLADYDCERPEGVVCKKMGGKQGVGSDTCPPCRAKSALTKAEDKINETL